MDPFQQITFYKTMDKLFYCPPSLTELLNKSKHVLTKMELVAEFVSISLSDTAPRDPVRFPPLSPPTPSPALLLKSLSAPRVSTELLLT